MLVAMYGFLFFPDILAVIGVAVSGTAYLMSRRDHMMRLRVISISAFLIYLFIEGALSGAFASLIGLTGTLIQVCVPERYLQKTTKLRAGAAIVLSLLGIAVLYQSDSVLPLVALIIFRIAEVQTDIQRIKLGFLSGQVLWLTYALEKGLIPFILSEAILMSCNLFAIIRYEYERRKTPKLQSV